MEDKPTIKTRLTNWFIGIVLGLAAGFFASQVILEPFTVMSVPFVFVCGTFVLSFYRNKAIRISGVIGIGVMLFLSLAYHHAAHIRAEHLTH
jgi:uncharacterized membrane protein YccC